jgi:DNA-binding LacI/PurR family transcriptional regulator
MIGIKRLAKDLNMSISTVSRALNERPDSSEATRKRVREAADRLGYVPNQSGRALRKGATGAVGIMIQTDNTTTGVGDTFFLSVFDGMQTVLARHDLDLVALLCGSEQNPDEYLKRAVSRGVVDGLVISATQRYDPRIDFLANKNLPFIALGRSLTDRGHSWFDLDFEGMAQMAVSRLALKGHHRIAVATSNDEIDHGYVLVDSYRAALEARGLSFDPNLVLRASPNQAGGYALARQVVQMDNGPTAILLTHEQMTVGLYRGVIDAGIMPGRDIAVIGRDNPYARFLSPTLTRFTTSVRDLGGALAEGLLANMPAYRALYPLGVTRRIWPLSLVEGESDAFEV